MINSCIWSSNGLWRIDGSCSNVSPILTRLSGREIQSWYAILGIRCVGATWGCEPSAKKLAPSFVPRSVHCAAMTCAIEDFPVLGAPYSQHMPVRPLSIQSNTSLITKSWVVWWWIGVGWWGCASYAARGYVCLNSSRSPGGDEISMGRL